MKSSRPANSTADETVDDSPNDDLIKEMLDEAHLTVTNSKAAWEKARGLFKTLSQNLKSTSGRSFINSLTFDQVYESIVISYISCSQIYATLYGHIKSNS